MTTKKQQLKRGFSLIEFIVILSLFAIMASVVTFDFQTFRNKIDRSNLATDIALSFRQMQVYGISSSNRNVGGVDFDDDDAGVESLVNENLILDTSLYGVEVDFSAQTITLYQETGGADNLYNPGADILVDILSVSGRNEILRICATADATQPQITNATGLCNFTFSSPGEEIDSGVFTATFKRPFPDASFYGSAFSGSFNPQTLLIVIGEPGAQGEDLDYIYFDEIGLVQLANPTIN